MSLLEGIDAMKLQVAEDSADAVIRSWWSLDGEVDDGASERHVPLRLPGWLTQIGEG